MQMPNGRDRSTKLTSLISRKAGFTLIELLVVIAIIGILASLVLASLNTARAKGRDGKRVSDIKQLQLALDLYYDAHGMYPTALSALTASPENDIPVVPNDPDSTTASPISYTYVPYTLSAGADHSQCTSYHLGSSLEVSSNIALASDSDVLSTPSNYQVCSGAATSVDFPGKDDSKCVATDPGSACYDVSP